MRKIGMFILLLQFSCLCLQAQPLPDDSSLSIQTFNIRVGTALENIARQTGMDFSFDSNILDLEAIIALSPKQVSLERTLEELSTQLGLDYAIVENQIVLYLSKESEQSFTVSGFVTDQSSGESLIGASVIIAGSNQGVFTNAFGFYSIQLKKGQHQIKYSYVGYEVTEVSLGLLKDEQKDISMSTASIDLPDIIVGQSFQNIFNKNQLGQMEFPPEKLGNMPEFAGESGLVKGLQSLPGIKMHSDGSTFFYTRGGERDQNLIIIDDAPIYNPSHLFGFYSLVVPDFAKSIQVYKSDIPTSLGDRLSSIVSIRTKDGNLNRLEVNGAVNPLMFRVSLETPTVKKKGSIFTSFRRSNFEWLYKKNAPNNDLAFGDFSFKWNHKVNEQDRVYFTAIWSADNFTSKPEGGETSGVRWGNLAATLRWNHIFGPKLFSNTTLYTGNYNYQLLFAPNRWESGLSTLSLKSDFTHYTSPVLESKFGIELQGYFINPGSLTLDSTIAIFPKTEPNNSQKIVLYYQGTWDFTEKIKLSGGLRMLSWSNIGPATYYDFDNNYEVSDTVEVGEGVYQNYLNVDPRISIQYQLDTTAQIKLSYGIYHQYLQLISNSESPFNSFEVWLPAGPNIKPQSAQQFALNYIKRFKNPKLEFSAAAYYKKFKHQIDYKDHALTLLNPLVEGELRFGTMQAYGVEFLLKKDFGRLNGSLGYTYSRALRKTAGINNDKTYPAFQDRPHDFSALLNYRLSKRVFCSFYYTAYTGSSFSAPTGFYTFNQQTIPVFGEKNNARLPTYKRLDIAFKFVFKTKEKSKFKHSLTFSVYNFFANKNVISVNFNKTPSNGSRPEVKANLLSDEALIASQIDLIRFFPSLTYKFKL